MNLSQESINTLLSTNEHRIATAIALQDDFKVFIKWTFYAINKKEFIFKEFHLKIIKALEDIVSGDLKKNLIINICPRYGKSAIVKYFCAWTYFRDIQCENIYTSYSDPLVLSFSDDIKGILQSHFLQCLCKIEFSESESSKRKWRIKGGGGLYARSMGGSITGFGCGSTDRKEYSGALFIDDPAKPIDMRSELMRNKVVTYFEETLSNRLNSPLTRIIIIMQRLHIHDLTGFIKEHYKDDYLILDIPSYDEKTKTPIWPEKHNSEFFEKLKIQNDYYYYSQYQQQPMIAGGNMAKRDWFQWYVDIHREEILKVFITIDTAVTTKESSDYSVMSLWAHTKRGLFLINFERGKWETPELKRMIIMFYNANKSIIPAFNISIHVEAISSGLAIFQDIRRETGLVISKVDRSKKKDKVTRFEDCLEYIFTGHVFFPKDGGDMVDVAMEEICSFSRDMSHKHDDFVDTLIDAIDIVQRNKKYDDLHAAYKKMKF